MVSSVEVAGVNVSVEFEEAFGENPARLHLRLPADCDGNKKIPPKTILFSARGEAHGKVIKSDSTTLRWAFEKPKQSFVVALKNGELGAIQDLSSMVAATGAAHVAKHSPKFPDGNIPGSLTVDGNLAYVPASAVHESLVKHLIGCDALSVCFIVRCNNDKMISPMGWVLYNQKQLIVNRDSGFTV